MNTQHSTFSHHRLSSSLRAPLSLSLSEPIPNRPPPARHTRAATFSHNPAQIGRQTAFNGKFMSSDWPQPHTVMLICRVGLGRLTLPINFRTIKVSVTKSTPRTLACAHVNLRTPHVCNRVASVSRAGEFKSCECNATTLRLAWLGVESHSICRLSIIQRAP